MEHISMTCQTHTLLETMANLTNNWITFITNSFFLIDSRAFWDCSTAQRNQLLADIAAADTACDGEVTRKTTQGPSYGIGSTKSCAIEFASSMEFFLMTSTSKPMHETHGSIHHGYARSKMFRTSLWQLLKHHLVCGITFRENDRPNPTKDEDSVLDRLLSRLLRASRNKKQGSSPRATKSSPHHCVERTCETSTSTTKSRQDISQLSPANFFCGKRSCESISRFKN